jgi:predicted transposase YdaD
MRQVVQSVSGLAPDQAVRWHGLLWFIVSWALQRRPPGEREALVEIAQAAQQTALAREEVGRMSQTIADSLREEGKREGREEGKREGREEGKLLAVREVLLHLLRDRFRRVPKAVRQQIAATTDVQRLQACVLQVNKVESLDELPL